MAGTRAECDLRRLLALNGMGEVFAEFRSASSRLHQVSVVFGSTDGGPSTAPVTDIIAIAASAKTCVIG